METGFALTVLRCHLVEILELNAVGCGQNLMPRASCNSAGHDKTHDKKTCFALKVLRRASAAKGAKVDNCCVGMRFGGRAALLRILHLIVKAGQVLRFFAFC